MAENPDDKTANTESAYFSSPYLEMAVDAYAAFVSNNAVGPERAASLFEDLHASIQRADDAYVRSRQPQAQTQTGIGPAIEVEGPRADEAEAEADTADTGRKKGRRKSAAARRAEASEPRAANPGDPRPVDERGKPIPFGNLNSKNSTHHDHIDCLHCGRPFKSLKRHLDTIHNQTPEEYKRYWSLAPDYPTVAPAYAERRKDIAAASGLGQRRAAPAAAAASE